MATICFMALAVIWLPLNRSILVTSINVVNIVCVLSFLFFFSPINFVHIFLC